jgi:hypothetical protein
MVRMENYVGICISHAHIPAVRQARIRRSRAATQRRTTPYLYHTSHISTTTSPHRYQCAGYIVDIYLPARKHAVGGWGLRGGGRKPIRYPYMHSPHITRPSMPLKSPCLPTGPQGQPIFLPSPFPCSCSCHPTPTTSTSTPTSTHTYTLPPRPPISQSRSLRPSRGPAVLQKQHPWRSKTASRVTTWFLHIDTPPPRSVS